MKHLLFTAIAILVSLCAVSQSVTLTRSGGWFEAAFVEWTPLANASSYNVYYTGGGVTGQRIDDQLIRSYGTYFRADIPGLSAGAYTLRVVPVIGGNESQAAVTSTITVAAHDRSGFAFANGRTPGAYQANGTPKSNAVILYITENTKNTVSLDITGATNPCIGLQTILDGYKKGKDTRPMIIRMVGQITDPSYMLNGDIAIENNNNAQCCLTLEGIGEDAVADGWGIRIKNATNIEIRNIGTMNCNSSEGDNIGLQQNNDYVWVHNCDFFYGDAGSDADQAKGDGALDCKKSTYVTFSYNHFWDSGKCNLLGLSEATTDGLFITYHHNWYDHSDSRHPRVRFYSAHVYNNYYDGNAKYGIGSTLGSSVFAEANYFRNCKYPMLTSMQGSDVYDAAKGTNDYKVLPTFSGEDGGTIKAFNNYMAGQQRFVPYGDPATASPDPKIDFDAYVAATRSQSVPSTVRSAYGSNAYNNFDINPAVMYSYTPQSPDEARKTVIALAGRMNGGDLKWTFDNAADDQSYAVNTGLKSALLGYTTDMVFIQGEGKPANQAPATAILSPAAGSKHALGTTISFAASATDPEGSVSSVVFSAKREGSADLLDLGSDNTAPYTASWTPTVAGTYYVYSKATDNEGKSGLSDQSYTVIIDDPNSNDAPAISISTVKSSYAEHSEILVTALATDDNAVAKVEFFDGTTLLKSLTASPYTYTISSASIGDYQITAVATDAQGLSSSATCSFTVETANASDLVHNFTASGNASNFFTISGNLSTSKGTELYQGLTLTQCLKMESLTTVSFTTARESELVLVFNAAFAGTVKIDNIAYSAAAGIVTATLPAGAHSIAKGDAANLYLMSITYSSTVPPASLSIDLATGWNLVSVNLETADMSIPALFPGAHAVKSTHGFWESGQASYLNSITSIQSGEGYLVWMASPATIHLEGTLANKTLTAWVPDGNWHLVGCPYADALPLGDAWGTALQSVQSIKDFDQYYDKGNPTNSLQSIVPGKAYFVK